MESWNGEKRCVIRKAESNVVEEEVDEERGQRKEAVFVWSR